MLVNQEQDNNITKKPVKEIKAAHKFLKRLPMTLKISNLQVPLWGQPVNDDLKTALSGSGETAQPPVRRSHQHNTKGHSTAPLHSSQSCQHKRSDRAISQKYWILGKQRVSINTQG